MMSSKMMMEMKEVNEPKPMEEWTNWTMEMKSISFWRARKWLIPPFLPIMDGKMGQYHPKMGKMGNITPERGKKPGDKKFLLYIHI